MKARVSASGGAPRAALAAAPFAAFATVRRIEQQRAVFEHAVVVDADRHEDQVALAAAVEARAM